MLTCDPACGQSKLDPKHVEFFEAKIRPTLVDICYRCHSQEAEKNKKLRGGLLVDSAEGLRKGGDSGPAIVEGKPNQGSLLKALRGVGDLKMPPNGKLPDHVIADFEKWIAMGATDPRAGAAPAAAKEIDLEEGRKFWAFQPIRQTPPPNVKDPAWMTTSIDRYVKQRLDEKGLKPVGLADARTLIKRLSVDLIGLPPTYDEVEAFAKEYKANAQAATAKLVDRLLARPQFGERWGRHWLDVARYADSNGNGSNYLFPHAWHYRNWVFDCFNADMPFTRFVTEQIAGDLLPAETDEQYNRQALGTGFLAIGSKNNMLSGEEFTLELISDQIDAIGRGFLGLSVACARCHDHKLDPIPTADYYAIAGILRSTSTRGGFEEHVEPSFSRRLKLLFPQNRDGFARAEAILKDREMVEFFVRRQQYENVQFRLEHLPANAKENDRKLLESSIAKTKEVMEKAREKLNGRPIPDLPNFVMGVLDEVKPADIPVRIRGDEKLRGPIVARGVLKVLPNQLADIPKTQSGRLQLAEWIATADNPLTARVYVNRVWHHLFGRGIVTTVDDFGSAGARPSHPELLDHLAKSFIDNGWSTKSLIRQIVLTRTYQLASTHDAENLANDPDNEGLWRHSRNYLDAESFRDAMLQASGRLDLRPGPTYITFDMMQGNNPQFHEKAMAEASDAAFRSVYLPVFRDTLIDSLSLFDFGDPTFVNGARSATTVSTQSLYLMNSPVIMREARTMAGRILAAAKDDPGRIRQAYQIASCVCRPRKKSAAARRS